MAALAVVVAGTFAAFAQWTRLDSIAPAAAASPCCGVWQIVPDGALVRIEPQALSGQFTISVVDSPDYAIAPGTVMGTMSEIAGNGRYHASLLTHPMRGNGSSRRDCIVEVQDNNLVFRQYADYAMKTKALAVLLLSVSALSTVAQRTTRPRLRPQPQEPSMEFPAAAPCIVVPDSGAVVLRGYDKPLRARRETVLAVNNSSDTIEALYVTFSYFDMNGRMLHRRSLRLPEVLPPQQTRMLTFPSWDTQNTYRYHLSAPAPRSAAVPYKVTVKVDSVQLYNKTE